MNVLANGLWALSSQPAAALFRRATHHVEEVQREKLLGLLRANEDSAYGHRYGFQDIHSAGAYQERVPLADYDSLRPWLQRVEQGEPAVLTSERVQLLEPTSGSSSATKLIPYTNTLKREFQAGIAPWVALTFGRHRALLRGKSYWSVTPLLPGRRHSPGGIPIGFEEDSEYLSSLSGRVVRTLSAVPPEVKLIEDLDSFRYVTLLFLLRSKGLSLISVWNPTFLMLLLEPLCEWGYRLALDIAGGSMTPPVALPPDVQSRLQESNLPQPVRALEIERILGSRAAAGTDDERGRLHRRLWPQLTLISCWADAAAAPYAARLARLFPQAVVQAKGLVSTEAFVSFPVPGLTGGALSLNSHFFEFIPIRDEGITEADDARWRASADDGPPILAHELVCGRHYSVVVTTGGGLYRYRTNDRIEVTGHLNGCPLIRFVGREDAVSDWFGEKLNEQHVARALDSVCARLALTPEFAMLACDDKRSPPAYTLYIQAASADDAQLAALARSLDAAFHDNYHYAYCRRMGQLDMLSIFRVEGDATSSYLRAASGRKQRVGDVKPSLLSRHGGWSQVFAGRRIAPSS
ncbi:MAG: GH3 auxin-responsive promoter family protein [Caldilineaceae bacterium]